jgi:serine/threonine protein kinase/Flp pilus assembly protein TadD
MILQPGSRPVPNCADYQLIRKLGAGAFGEVWHARGPGGLDVALKFIHLEAPSHALELRSLEAMKGIRHPNLVSLFGAWHVNYWLILAMELCDRSLQDRLREVLYQKLDGVPTEELLSYMRDAANGLDALNANHVQHRDVKPGNLLLLSAGVKVADFGLAKALEQTVASNSGAGTIAYIAPECFKGKLTQQSDQYSLAVTYYHLRTGRLLFKGDQAQVMYAHLELEPDLSRLLPGERAVLARALSKEPDKRWQTCKIFVNELVNAHRPPREKLLSTLALRSDLDRRKEVVRIRRRFWSKLVLDRLGREARPATGERLQTLLYHGSDRGYLTYDQVSDYLNVRLFRIEPDGPIKLIPDDAVNRRKLDQLLVVLDEHEIELIDGTEAIDYDPDDPLAYYNSGNAWFDRQEYEKAVEDFDSAIWRDPENATTYNFLRGMALLAREDVCRTIADYYDQVIRLHPEAAAAFYFRALNWEFERDHDKAIDDYVEAIRLRPNDRDDDEIVSYSSSLAYARLAWLLSTCPDDTIRDGKRAIQLATKACELTDWKSGWELNTLAAAYAEAGQFDEAERYQIKALQDVGSRGAAVRRRLELYEQKKPYRECH